MKKRKRMSSRTRRIASVASAMLALAIGCVVGTCEADEPASGRWAIALHGGAGSLPPEMTPHERASIERSLREALAVGKQILSGGGRALDAVEAVVVVLEDDPQFNAGKGAVFNRAGEHELDASIMDGATLRCGAVAGVRSLRNPIKAARLVMERSPHVLLAGEGADQFASEHGCERVAQAYFYTERRFVELQAARAKTGLGPLARPAHVGDPESTGDPALKGPGGTVGCVALDGRGNLAAATSTGGLTGKLPGRVGDTPICGAGTYANNRSCAVSGTGKGEEFIRHSIAAKVGWLVEERGFAVEDAVGHCLEKILQPGDGGMIAVDREGRVAMRASTAAMPRGVADSTGRFEVSMGIDRQ
jgi:beta-aspartyl-peptidase (threonine type)